MVFRGPEKCAEQSRLPGSPAPQPLIQLRKPGSDEHCLFPYKVSSTNMEGLRELRGMVGFPAEETTRGYFCYSTDYVDYAAHLAYTSLYAIRLMKHTNYADYADKITNT